MQPPITPGPEPTPPQEPWQQPPKQSWQPPSESKAASNTIVVVLVIVGVVLGVASICCGIPLAMGAFGSLLG